MTPDEFATQHQRAVARLAGAVRGKRRQREAELVSLVARKLRLERRDHVVAAAIAEAQRLLAEIRRRADTARPAQGDLFDPSHWRMK